MLIVIAPQIRGCAADPTSTGFGMASKTRATMLGVDTLDDADFELLVSAAQAVNDYLGDRAPLPAELVGWSQTVFDEIADEVDRVRRRALRDQHSRHEVRSEATGS